MSKTRERDEFIALMTRECPGVGVYDLLSALRRLMRLSARHGNLCVRLCNEQEPPYEQTQRVESRIAVVAAELGCQAVTQRDPRGCTVKLKVPSERTNDFGGVGICVPQ